MPEGNPKHESEPELENASLSLPEKGSLKLQAELADAVSKSKLEPKPKSDDAKAPKRRLSSLFYLFRYLKAYPTRWLGAIVALMLTSGITLLLGQGVKQVIDTGFAQGSVELLNRSLLVFLFISVLLALGTYVRFYLVSWLGERVSADIRRDVFNHIVSLHPGYFETNRSGEISSRITADTTLLQSIIGSSFSMALRSSINSVGGLVMLFLTNVKLMGVILLSVPLVVVPMVLFGRRVKKLSRDSQESIADVGSYAGEIIQNIKTVQSFTQENSERGRFERHVERAFSIARMRIRQRALLMAVVMLLLFFALAGMVWVGGKDVIAGAMTAGDLAAFVFYALLVAMGVATISEVYGELQRAAGATDRLVELLSVEREIDLPNDEQKDHQTYSAAELPAALIFNGINFYYPSRPEQNALDGIDIEIAEGECVALVGPSGAGKTTIFELVQRFYDPQAGSVCLGGIDVRLLSPQDLRQQLAVVPQHPSLFTADVGTNIRYGCETASDEEVEAAAKAAFAHEFIQRLPEAYQSFLGEQGVRLSGGQKQRIAIARAILKNPRILLLDEATSALDSESEYQVQRALDQLMKNRTTLIIAHRLSTVLHADRIIVMEAGKVVAEGSHDQLLKSSPLYQRLASLQFNDAAS